jgi:hypothetical protein
MRSFEALKEKRDEGKRTAPCSDNEFDWSRMGSESEPDRERVPIGQGWAPIRQDRTLSSSIWV